MSNPTYLKNLKEYVRRQLGGTGADPTLAVQNVMGESDRGAVILASTSVEDMLEWKIISRLPNLLVDPAARDPIFSGSGMLSTFSAKISMAYAMGIIDKAARREIDLIREMRNACAHARQEISFSQPVLQDVCKQVIAEVLHMVIKPAPPEALRHMFVLKCTFLCQYIVSGQRPDMAAEIQEAVSARDREKRESK